MSDNKELYNKEKFVELSSEEDMKVVGGDNALVRKTSIVFGSIFVAIKEKLFD